MDCHGYICMQPLRKTGNYLFPGSFYGIFCIFIPQGIDQGIQHWDNKCVKYGRHFISLKCLTVLRLHIHKYQSPIEDSDHCQMRPTGRKSLLPAFSRVHPENSSENEQIGSKNDQW